MKTLAEKIEVMQAALSGSEIEVFDRTYPFDGWIESGNPSFDWVHYDYRIKPKESFKLPDGFWKCVESQWLSIAKDSDGRVFLFDDRNPKSNDGQWLVQNPNYYEYKNVTEIFGGLFENVEWQDSLVVRPE